MELSIEALIAEVTQGMSLTTRTRSFNFPLTRQQTETLLLQAYKAQVAARGMQFVLDDSVRYYISEFSDWLTDPTDKCFIMFSGGCGCGKTTLALAFRDMTNAICDKAYKAPEFLLKDKPAEVQRQYAQLARFPRVSLKTAQEISDAARRSREDRTDEYYAIKRSAFLIIDDLGCEPVEVKNFGTSVTPITDIIYERYAAMKPTIITTNLDTRQIRSEYNERVADRLNEICRVIGYKNESYRK